MGGENPQALTTDAGDDSPRVPQTPTTPNQAAPTPAPTPAPKRGGLAGIVDVFRDAIAGTQGPGTVVHGSQNADGSITPAHVEHNPLTHGQQWARIAADALRGAGAGMAHGTGPGGKFKALEAGIDSGESEIDRARKAEQETNQEARQENTDLFNQVKLKHDLAASEFAFGRAKIVAKEQDVQFAQSQIDREKQLGSADLGVYKDEADLARVKEVHPEFWKSVHDNNIVAVPELDESGNRKGIHVFLRAPGVGSQLAPPGTPIKVFRPGKTPADSPTLETQVPTIPMTLDQVDQYNNAATAKLNDWQHNQLDTQVKQQQIATGKANATKDLAEANKANAEADKARSEAAAAKTSADQDAVVDEIISGSIVPERIGLLLSKKDGQALLAKVGARAQASGIPFDLSKLQAYPKLAIDYTTGKVSQSMVNMNTALQAIEELSKLNTYSSRIPGTDAKHSFESKLTDVSAEIANGLAKPGVSATKDEIHQVKQDLSTFANRESAMREKIHTMIDQYKSFRNKWQESSPSAAFANRMPDLSPDAKNVIRKYAPDESQEWWGRPVYDHGTLIGYSKDGKTLSEVAGGQR